MGKKILKTYFEWDGDLDVDVSKLRLKGGKFQKDNIQPLGTWSGEYPHARMDYNDWTGTYHDVVFGPYSQCFEDAPPFSRCYLEDWDLSASGSIDVNDIITMVGAIQAGNSTFTVVHLNVLLMIIEGLIGVGNYYILNAPTPLTYTWGDVSLIFDIIRSGSRGYRAILRDREKKKKLIHLICRIKGEKVYDETKEIEDIEIRMEDINLVINEVMGSMQVKTKENYEVV